MVKGLWLGLVVFRMINALAVTTFFQPDEYFQSLEPAWQLAFGTESGAWITWEWEYRLRSSLHPAIFGAFYFVAGFCLRPLEHYPHLRALILTNLPNLVQAYFAALGDFYTWQLAEKIYGRRNHAAWATLWISLLSPWQWFFSTRTFSNCLEMTLTTVALYFWPWALSSESHLHPTCSDAEVNGSVDVLSVSQTTDIKFTRRLSISLTLAGTASIIRPTNLSIWLSLLVPHLGGLIMRPTHRILSRRAYFTLTRQAIYSTALVLFTAVISDRLFYQTWTFPPYQWLHFNIIQDVAVFYGANNWHYYFTEGLPQLLTTYLPFALAGLWHAWNLPSGDIRFVLATSILATLGVLSLTSHKEVRFIYPILPLLHILAAPHIAGFFIDIKALTRSRGNTLGFFRHKNILISLLSINLLIAYYTTRIHQSGVIAIFPYLRRIYEENHATDTSLVSSFPSPTAPPYLAFLMPCHSTPFRSALIYPGLTAWALTCSPPLDTAPGSIQRANYRDEADRFFADPVGFLAHEVGASNNTRAWPTLVIGFASIETPLRLAWEAAAGHDSRLTEVTRVFNSHWHDDPRRMGPVVVWKLWRGSKAVDFSPS